GRLMVYKKSGLYTSTNWIEVGRSERVLEQPIEPPLSEGHTSGSGEGMMEHQFELTANVLDLEKEMDAQAVEILILKKSVKRLERQRKPSTSQPKRRKYRQVESSDDDLNEEDASKQGRSSDKTEPMLRKIYLLGLHTNSPQLDNEDLQQIHPDDLEEMDLRVIKQKKVWICQISQEISQKRTRERMSDQEAKEIKAEAREIMPQPSTVNCS
ncbi:hypothetical protein Tco_1374338, partial [Tanacetum coccineum]